MKKIHRFLLPAISASPTIELLEAEVVHHIKNVLKLTPGEDCIVFCDGGNDYLCEIQEVNKTSIVLRVKEVISQKTIPQELTACVSITKRDTFELLVQKLTELGIKEIVPIISERTVKQALRIDRLQKISDEALEQSGGSNRVSIREPQPLQSALEEFTALPSYCFDMDGEKLEHSTSPAVFYIGPEGGWSDTEHALFSKYGIKNYSLGGTTLRTETAAIIATHTLIWN